MSTLPVIRTVVITANADIPMSIPTPEARATVKRNEGRAVSATFVAAVVLVDSLDRVLIRLKSTAETPTRAPKFAPTSAPFVIVWVYRMSRDNDWSSASAAGVMKRSIWPTLQSGHPFFKLLYNPLFIILLL
jgi:hypothetical protein